MPPKTYNKVPIWKDTFYESTRNSLQYSIDVNGSTIFSGKAYRLPGADVIKININKICQNYLDNNIDSFFEDETGPLTEEMPGYNALKKFELRSGGAVLAEYYFYYNWDYKTQASRDDEINISHPINGHYTTGMRKPVTIVKNYAYEDEEGNAYPGVVTLNESTGYDTFVECADYALYYLNASGGWDAFLIEGGVKVTDQMVQYTTDRSYDNNTNQFEEERYITEINRTYQMTSGWLNDEESESFAVNLMQSNRVYLHNLKENRIIPVIITDTNVLHQTYQGNGKKMAQYTMNAKESQSHLRR